jgi:hypothetical protein
MVTWGEGKKWRRKVKEKRRQKYKKRNCRNRERG